MPFALNRAPEKVLMQSAPAFSSRLATRPLPALAIKMGIFCSTFLLSFAIISAREVRGTIILLYFFFFLKYRFNLFLLAAGKLVKKDRNAAMATKIDHYLPGVLLYGASQCIAKYAPAFFIILNPKSLTVLEVKPDLLRYLVFFVNLTCHPNLLISKKRIATRISSNTTTIEL
jgi:hypothetical protein